jgi:hypothetical protein
MVVEVVDVVDVDVVVDDEVVVVGSVVDVVEEVVVVLVGHESMGDGEPSWPGGSLCGGSPGLFSMPPGQSTAVDPVIGKT